MIYDIEPTGQSKEPRVSLDMTPLGAPVPAAPRAQTATSRPSPASPRATEPVVQNPWAPKPRSMLLMSLAYTLGCLAPVFLRQGKRRFTWAIVGLLTGGALGAMLWYWEPVRSWLEQGRFALLPWLVAVVVATLAGMTAWSRAVLLCGRDPRFVPERLPRFACHPVAVAIQGILVPGSGLLVAGHPLRAAMALWIVAPLGLSVLALMRSEWLWSCNRSLAVPALPLMALEVVLVTSLCVAIGCALAWIGMALDGGRLAAHRAGRRGSAGSDWLPLAAAAVVVIFFVTLAPAQRARDLDHLAQSMRHDAYRLIPLCMEHAAMKLDPSQPRYVMHAAELYDLLDRHDTARAYRDDLRDRWREYAEMLLQEELAVDTAARPDPIDARPEDAGTLAAGN